MLSAQPQIAVTGATGLVGRALIPLLVQAGARVRVLARSPQHAQPGVEAVAGDLLDSAALEQLVDSADAVIHLGGIAHTSLRSDAERNHARDVNLGATVRLLDLAKRAGVKRFLFASTAHVYTGQQGLDLDEQSAVSGDSFYSSLKLEAEAAAQQASRDGLHTVILRPCIVYGPGVRFNLASLMQAIRRGYYFHAGGAHPVRSFASVDTVAAAFHHLLTAGENGEAYNVADAEPVFLDEWTNQLAGLLGARRPRTLPLPLLQTAAGMLSPLAAIGLPAPLTPEKLGKLTASFSLNVSKLRASGFQWPHTNEQVLEAMVQKFLQDSHERQGAVHKS